MSLTDEDRQAEMATPVLAIVEQMRLVAARLDLLGVEPKQLEWMNDRLTVQVAAENLDLAGDAMDLTPAHREGSLWYRGGEWNGITVNLYTGGNYRAPCQACGGTGRAS
jgi:hypothetical protein